MKKQFKQFSVLFAAAALMTACSNDEPMAGNDPDEVPADGYTAYVTVNIKDAGEMMTRAVNNKDDYHNPDDLDNAENGDYIWGDAAEHKVDNARFFFYDANGTFVTEANVWKDAGDGPDENVEYLGKNLLVLKGLTTNTTPVYMITALNLPTTFKPGRNIDDTRNALLEVRNSGRFIMSTSSFYGSYASDKYGTNKLKPENFILTVTDPDDPTKDPVVDDTKDNVVQVYVERLAAKIQVLNKISSEQDKWVSSTDDIYYKVKATVGGSNNEEGEETEGLTEVYVKLSNWGINGVTANSKLSKDITGFGTEFSTANAIGNWAATDWNNNEYHRSFWGKSVVYNSDPESKLGYINYNDAKIGFVEDDQKGLYNYDYCPENTNVVDKIKKANDDTKVSDRKVTSVIFTATVYEAVKDASNNITGMKTLDLVRFNGQLYRKADFFQYTLNSLNAQGKMNYYHKTTTTVDGKPVDEYTQFTAADFDLDWAQDANAKTGEIYVYSKLKGTEGKVYYTKSVAADGTVSYSENALPFNEAAVKTLNDNLKKFYSQKDENTESFKGTAIAYNGGMMYYSVPVEHLYKTRGTNDAVVEGNYGVVRNHWYRITLNSLTNLGSGVFDPDNDKIKPEDDDDEFYHLGATVNILSWKIVTQNVDL